MPFYSREERSVHPLKSKLGGPHSRSGLYGEQKNTTTPLPEIDLYSTRFLLIYITTTMDGTVTKRLKLTFREKKHKKAVICVRVCGWVCACV